MKNSSNKVLIAIIIILVIALVGLGGAFVINSFNDQIDDLKDEIKDLEKEKSDYEESISEILEKFDEKQKEHQELEITYATEKQKIQCFQIMKIKCFGEEKCF